MISGEKILSIKDFPSLVKFLVEELQWPIDLEEFEDFDTLAYNFAPEEIGLNEKFFSKIKEIKQLRPIDDLPFAIFWIDFEEKNLPIVALRKILAKFVTKKRDNQDRLAWESNELIFITGHGLNENKAITFAKFKSKQKNKYSLREFWWDKNERDFSLAKNKLNYLRWPSDNNQDSWIDNWGNAFKGSIRENIRTSQELVKILAINAQQIKTRVEEIYEIENENGEFHILFKNFKKFLIHDISFSGKNSFADTYAQTITYGLFAARCMDRDGKFEVTDILEKIPNSNPFLKKFFSYCLGISGSNKFKLTYEDLGVAELIEALDSLNTDDGDMMQEILNQFGRLTNFGKEDPVIHFYEDFLKLYDPIGKKLLGEYYTPDPVVKCIVNLVNQQLIKKFKLPLGLADTTKWGVLVRKKIIKIPAEINNNDIKWKELKNKPFVQILDPATGTGTFIKYVIEIIHQTMTNKWLKEGKTNQKINILWNRY
jgi:hypothetical protein